MRAEWGRGGSAALARPLADDGAPCSAVGGDWPAATALGSASSARLGKRCSASGGTPSGGTPRGAEVGVGGEDEGDGALPSGVAAAARAAAAAPAARDAALVGVLLWRGLLVDMLGVQMISAVDLDL